MAIFSWKSCFFGSRDVARIILLAQQPLSRRQRGNNNNNKQKNKNKQKTIATGSRTVAGGPMLVTENDLFSFFFHWRAVTSSGRDHAPGLIMQMTHLAHPFVPLPWHRGGQPIPVKPGEKKTTQKRRDTETSDWDRFSFVIVSSSFHDCLPSCSRKGVGLELELVGLPNSLSATSNRRGAFV